MKKTLLAILVLSLVLTALTTSCAKQSPDAERKAAEKALRDAMIGKDCQKEEYLAAEELLNAARKEMNKKNYEKAKELFAKIEKKADAILKFYNENPEKCNPEKMAKKSDKNKKDEIEENLLSSDSPLNPDMVIPKIYFDFDSYEIKESSIPDLNRIAEWMQNFPEKSITIEGHTDERGATAYNLVLGEKRADEIKKALGRKGINLSRIKIVSFGEEKPAVNESNEDAWAQNRRGEPVKNN